MTPYPHPYGDSSLKLVHRGHAPGFSLIETTCLELPTDKLAALVAIADSDWAAVSYHGGDESIHVDRDMGLVLRGDAEWLLERGLLMTDPMDWGITYHVSPRGAQVVELAMAQKGES